MPEAEPSTLPLLAEHPNVVFQHIVFATAIFVQYSVKAFVAGLLFDFSTFELVMSKNKWICHHESTGQEEERTKSRLFGSFVVCCVLDYIRSENVRGYDGKRRDGGGSRRMRRSTRRRSFFVPIFYERSAASGNERNSAAMIRTYR